MDRVQTTTATTLKKQQHKKCEYERTMNTIL